MPRPSLSLVVPCFNEEAVLARVVVDAVTVGRRLACPFELIVVDDGSVDGTPALLATLGRVYPELRTVRHAHNRGYGAALRSGFVAARYHHVASVDGDGQFVMDDLSQLVAKLAEAPVVAGYRAARRDGHARWLLGRLWTWLAGTLLGASVRDLNCAFKIFPREFVQAGPFKSTGALISAELLSEARRQGLAIVEVPVRHLPRRTGNSTGALPRVIWRAITELAQLAFRRPPHAAKRSAASVRDAISA